MFTRNKFALPAAAIAQTIAAQITRKSELLTAAAVCGLLLCGNARGQDSPGAMRISASTADQATPARPRSGPCGPRWPGTRRSLRRRQLQRRLRSGSLALRHLAHLPLWRSGPRLRLPVPRLPLLLDGLPGRPVELRSARHAGLRGGWLRRADDGSPGSDRADAGQLRMGHSGQPDHADLACCVPARRTDRAPRLRWPRPTVPRPRRFRR